MKRLYVRGKHGIWFIVIEPETRRVWVLWNHRTEYEDHAHMFDTYMNHYNAPEKWAWVPIRNKCHARKWLKDSAFAFKEFPP